MMSADADAVCGAEPTAAARRSGSTAATVTGREAGTLASAPSSSRSRSCAKGPTFRTFSWSLDGGPSEPWSAVVAESYVNGVSTRKVERVAQAMGIDRLSKSRVSEMAQTLDATVEAFRNRPLECRSLSLPLARCPGDQEPGGRPHRQCRGGASHRRQRRGLPRDPGCRRDYLRRRCRLAGFLEEVSSAGVLPVSRSWSPTPTRA